jgi:hypothetical protein
MLRFWVASQGGTAVSNCVNLEWRFLPILHPSFMSSPPLTARAGESDIPCICGLQLG